MLSILHILFVDLEMYLAYWKVFVAQKKILRTITFKGEYNLIDLLFNDIRILKFDLLLKYFMILSIYRNINNNDPNNITFNVFHHSKGTRGNHLNLRCPKARTTFYKYSIHCRGPKVWNTLPDNINSFSYFNTFKK